MVRTIGVFSAPAALIALAWLRLEKTPVAGPDWIWAVLLALAPALAPVLWLRLALVVPATLVALWVALDTPSPDDRPGFFEPVYLRFDEGFFDFYDVVVPFDGAQEPNMHGALVLAIFSFCLVLAQLVAARRPLPAVLTIVAGAGWPTALYPLESVAYGALILAAALWVLAGLRSAKPGPALVAGAAIVVAAAAASSSAAVAKDGVLAWERWDPTGSARAPVSVSYVWDANYGGIEFPEKATTVLRISGPERGLYWRATTLDDFDGDRWLQAPVPLSTAPARGLLPRDPLLPARARDPKNWVRQDVEVVALADIHVVAAAQPVKLDGPQLGNVFRLSSGIVQVPRGLQRGQRYTVYSYAPRPGPADLAGLPAAYPRALKRFLDIGRTRVEPFGTPNRDQLVEELFEDERYLALWPYREVWEQAKRLRADARTPYGAVVAIETWLRTTGGFRYDEQPPRPAGLPPLAHFVAESKRGYCQQFAGAMALMLRLLGVPARVGAGFTSGTRETGGWKVADRNAHTWVEVWFPGYGWLPFDPTPGRGSLAASYSASSSGFNAGDAAEAFGDGSGARASGGGVDQLRLFELRERLEARRRSQVAAEERTNIFRLLALLALGTVLAVAGAKLVRRRARYLTRDPRRLATAARRELADFLADQGLVVDASATPEDLHRLVRSELGADGRPFARALAEARYGPPDASRDAAARAQRELRTLLRAVRATLGRPARLRGLVALRSLRT